MLGNSNPIPSNICTKLESYCFSGFEGIIILKKIFFSFFFLNLMLPWQPNKRVTGHQTHKLDRLSSYDVMIITAKYASHHFSGYGQNAIESFYHYKSMGAFCCQGNHTKRQITTISAILNCPYPSNICTKLEYCCFSGFEGVVI